MKRQTQKSPSPQISKETTSALNHVHSIRSSRKIILHVPIEFIMLGDSSQPFSCYPTAWLNIDFVKILLGLFR